MATITQVATIYVTGGPTGTSSSFSYQPNDLLIGFCSTSSPTTSVTESSLIWSFTQFTITPITWYGSIISRVASTPGINKTVTMNFSGGGGYCFAAIYRVRPDAGNSVALDSVAGKTDNSAVTIPGPVGSRSVIFGARAFRDSGVDYTDTDTTAGSWSATSTVRFGETGGVNVQYKQPTGPATQEYGGAISFGGYYALMGANIIESNLGYWGVRL